MTQDKAQLTIENLMDAIGPLEVLERLESYRPSDAAACSDIPPEWAAKAAEEIDAALADVVRKNTGIQSGFFAGISINDMARIIARHCQNH